MGFSFISNSCVGMDLFNAFGIKYNNPFIGTLIQNDEDYIKLVNNIEFYANETPIIDLPKQPYYKHPDIPTTYPVLFLGDIEIHCMHETDNFVLLEKFTRRLERFRLFLQNKNNKIFAVFSFSELLNNRNIRLFIDDFFQHDNNKYNYVEKIFLGPTKYNKQYTHYIDMDEWDNIALTRNSSNVYVFNNQNKNVVKFKEYIKIRFDHLFAECASIECLI
jgi:uncharacterized protein (DUF1919 family)